MRLAIALLILFFSDIGKDATFLVFVLVFWKWIDE